MFMNNISPKWYLQDAIEVLEINQDAQNKLMANELEEGKDVLGLAASVCS